MNHALLIRQESQKTPSEYLTSSYPHQSSSHPFLVPSCDPPLCDTNLCETHRHQTTRISDSTCIISSSPTVCSYTTHWHPHSLSLGTSSPRHWILQYYLCSINPVRASTICIEGDTYEISELCVPERVCWFLMVPSLCSRIFLRFALSYYGAFWVRSRRRLYSHHVALQVFHCLRLGRWPDNFLAYQFAPFVFSFSHVTMKRPLTYN